MNPTPYDPLPADVDESELLDVVMLLCEPDETVKHAPSSVSEQIVILGNVPQRLATPTAQPNGYNAFTSSYTMSPPAVSKKRKAPKTCTYARRRTEVAMLQNEVASIQAELLHLQYKRRYSSPNGATQAQHEEALLRQSMAENARLKELVQDQEIELRRLEAVGL